MEKIIDGNSDKDKNMELEEIKAEMTVVLNLEKKKMQFIKDNKLKGEFKDIKIDKDIQHFPGVFLYNKNDSVKIEGFK